MTQKLVELMISLARADMLVMKIDSPVQLSSYINAKGKRYFLRRERVTSMVVEDVISVVGSIDRTAGRCSVSV